MLELYEQNRPSQASEAEGRVGGSQRPPSKGPRGNAEHTANCSSSHGGSAPTAASLKPASSRLVPDQPHADNHSGSPRVTQTQSSDYVTSETNSNVDHKGNDEISGRQQQERQALLHQANSGKIQNKSMFRIERHVEDDQEGNSRGIQTRDIVEQKDAVGQSPQVAKTKLDKEKLKAASERRKARGDVTQKMDTVNGLEWELEDVQLPGGIEKIKQDRKQSAAKSSNRLEYDNSHLTKHESEAGDGHHQEMKGQFSHGNDFDMVEEGEVEPFDDAERGSRSPTSSIHQRKAGSPFGHTREGKAVE